MVQNFSLFNILKTVEYEYGIPCIKKKLKFVKSIQKCDSTHGVPLLQKTFTIQESRR